MVVWKLKAKEKHTLPHITNSEPPAEELAGAYSALESDVPKGRVVCVSLHAKGLLGYKLDDGGVAGLDEFGRWSEDERRVVIRDSLRTSLDDLPGTPVNLCISSARYFKSPNRLTLNELGESCKYISNQSPLHCQIRTTGNLSRYQSMYARSREATHVGGVAIEDRGVTSTDLTGVVEDDDLGVERSGLLGRVVLRVRRNVASADILDGHVLDVEADVVSFVGVRDTPSRQTNTRTRQTLRNLLVVHLNGFDLGSDVRGRECDNHAGFDYTGLDPADWDCANTANFVNILQR